MALLHRHRGWCRCRDRDSLRARAHPGPVRRPPAALAADEGAAYRGSRKFTADHGSQCDGEGAGKVKAKAPAPGGTFAFAPWTGRRQVAAAAPALGVMSSWNAGSFKR